MRVRASIGFTFRGEPVVVADPATARMTVLDWLRGERLGVGTKEGCAEGDCGACTAVLARGIDGRAHVATVNTCILMVGQLDGCTLVTIEDLAGRDGTLHPVQAAMIEQHGAQCGFCTPGIVMSLVALHETGERPLDRSAVLDQLAGNLCRCTGYRPIVAAALAAAAEPPRGDATQAAARAPVADPGADVLVGDDHSFFAAPASEATLQALLDRHPDALILAGATDAGLTLTKALAQPAKVIWLGRVVGLDQIADEGDVLCLGASATLEAAKPRLAAIAPDLGEVMRRFGSLQVRNSGTVGGNIANASPIGDLAPCLIALGARLELASSSGRRELPLEDYFLAYKRQDRHAGEYVSRVRVPRLAAGCHFKAYKISKRRDEDISAVLGAVQQSAQQLILGRGLVAAEGVAVDHGDGSDRQPVELGEDVLAELGASVQPLWALVEKARATLRHLEIGALIVVGGDGRVANASAAANADVGGKRVARRDDGTAADDRVELGHLSFPDRSNSSTG